MVVRAGSAGERRWFEAATALAGDAASRVARVPVRPGLDVAALATAYAAAFGTDGTLLDLGASGALQIASAVITGLVCLCASGAYSNRRPLFRSPSELITPALVGSLAGALVFVLARLAFSGSAGRHAEILYIGAAVTLVGAARAALQLFGDLGLSSFRNRLLVVAPAHALSELRDRVSVDLAPGFVVADSVPLDCAPDGPSAAACARIADAAARSRAAEVVILDPTLTPRALSVLVTRLCPRVRVRVGSRGLLTLAQKAGLAFDRFGDMAIVEFGPVAGGRLHGLVKRVFDCIVSLAAIIMLLPLWAVVAGVLAVSQGRPIFFRQMRVKGNGGRFAFYKFRTMVNGAQARMSDDGFRRLNSASEPMFKCPSDPRVTPAGRWLRRFSLDEAPQFMNVLRGHISVVGARPPLPDEVARYDDWHRVRLSGWMGITGLWQVSDRNGLDFDDVVTPDLLYNSHSTIAQDIRIVWKTIGAVIVGRGAY